MRTQNDIDPMRTPTGSAKLLSIGHTVFTVRSLGSQVHHTTLPSEIGKSCISPPKSRRALFREESENQSQRYALLRKSSSCRPADCSTDLSTRLMDCPATAHQRAGLVGTGCVLW